MAGNKICSHIFMRFSPNMKSEISHPIKVTSESSESFWWRGCDKPFHVSIPRADPRDLRRDNLLFTSASTSPIEQLKLHMGNTRLCDLSVTKE